MPKHSFNTLMRRLSRAGFPRQFVDIALLPDWWEVSYSRDSEVLTEIELRVARFLDVPLSIVKNADQPLTLPSYAGAQLRRVRNNVNPTRLNPAIHAATQVGGAVIRNLRHQGQIHQVPPDPLEWRHSLVSPGKPSIELAVILHDLWKKNIPVVPLDVLPSPTFQGMSSIVDDTPVIFLGHKHDQPARVAFIVAHEGGHIASGDCAVDTPVLHEGEGVEDDSDDEQRADSFARAMLLGENPPCLDADLIEAKALAQRAFDLEEETGADASTLIYNWAGRTLDYANANLAVKALYRSTGGKNLLRKHFEENVDFESATETDRSLLKSVYGNPESSKAGY